MKNPYNLVMLPFLIIPACATQPVRPSAARPAAEVMAAPEPWMLDLQVAGVAYLEKRYDDCVELYLHASRRAGGRAKADALYTAGSCRASQGLTQQAVALFRGALEAHPSYCEDILSDTNLEQSLNSRSEWQTLVRDFEATCAQYRGSINDTLRRVHQEDQSDRSRAPDDIDWKVVTPRDESRREQVRSLEASAQLSSADDYYHAAVVMQHGENESSYQSAYRLARRAVALDPSFVKARWLVAASLDRYHMSRTEPQLYGTQYKLMDGRWILWPVDQHSSDRDRAIWCVPPLEMSKRAVIKLNTKSRKN